MEKHWFDGGYSYLVQIDGAVMIGSRDHAPRAISLSSFSKQKADLICDTAIEKFGVDLKGAER